MKQTLTTLGLLALAAASPLSAGTLTFSDRTTWLGQVSNLSNFDGGTQTAGTTTSWGAGGLILTALQNLTIEGFNILGTDPPITINSLTRANAGAGQNYYNWNSGAILKTDDKTPTNTVFARISFPNPVSAFGFNFGVGGCQSYFNGCFPGAAASVTIAPGGLSSVNVNTTSTLQTFNFWGVVSDTQTFTFADIFINDASRYIVLDDIAQGSFGAPPPTETAEPGTLIQLAMGAGLLAASRRRRQRQET